ncbi:LuxR family transcriptional regulator [Parvibium lacunae]|uniref:LuxR family transcriptional regulator n=1 Tax=Parvibium lacunae TaxID=1888893 RepID=A0A368L7W3_9BURK|nr:LuxR family transcriptional regulator [Parvibium lacunae]RCS59329.1 LuxR family transcriptional regulator [Parvibium lacunae]
MPKSLDNLLPVGMPAQTPAAEALQQHLQVVQDIIGLAESPDLTDLHGRTKRIVNALGFEAFLYGVQVQIDPERPFEFIFSGYPKEWMQRYQAENFKRIDPVFVHCIRKRRIVPMLWDPDAIEHTGAQFFEEAATFGLSSGVTIPISSRSNERALLSLASSYEYHHSKPLIMHALGDTSLLGTYLHEAIHRLVLQKESWLLQEPVFSPREYECLKWAAGGKTAWEIGTILGISERTAIFHLNNVVRKLGVANRKQAIARATALGLI